MKDSDLERLERCGWKVYREGTIEVDGPGLIVRDMGDFRSAQFFVDVGYFKQIQCSPTLIVAIAPVVRVLDKIEVLYGTPTGLGFVSHEP